jgi:hypothetical protein
MKSFSSNPPTALKFLRAESLIWLLPYREVEKTGINFNT